MSTGVTRDMIWKQDAAQSLRKRYFDWKYTNEDELYGLKTKASSFYCILAFFYSQV
jgi:hypothetical protein